MTGRPDAGHAPGSLRISLRSLAQLFNSLDPSPFNEKDLDAHAEEFIVSWAQELPHDAPLRLTLHLKESPPDGAEHWVPQAIHHHFTERARLTRLALRRLLRQGRTSLAIGLSFMTACLLLAQAFRGIVGGPIGDVLRESLTVGGWVAMWRPLQIYLYDWWPLRREEHVYRRMAAMPVRIRADATNTP